MKSNALNKLLNDLKLNNAIFFKNKENQFVNALNVEINLHFDIQNKLEIIKPDAIYVFNNQPFILFFDLTESSNEREDDVHKKVWSFDNSPVIFIIKDKDISIYNALSYSKKDKHLEEIKISEEERNKKFSFWNLQSGETWKWFQEEYIEKNRNLHHKKRVNQQLFENIKQVRKKLICNTLKEEDVNILILRLIFIRYLVDRKVEIPKNYISGEIETINDRRKCFCELITQSKQLNNLFVYLNDRFNGVLFKDANIHLTEKQANDLSAVFAGEIPDKNSLFYGIEFFFEIFDFSIIPVELISGIYESLIDEETRDLDSAVYTPSFLVDYILSDTVDKYLENAQTSDCKVFEVAVGSGIFLVQSLRRMIEKEKKLNPKATNEEFSYRIREIAKNNLFGIDINESALKVTCFSIYIALLDYQEPKEISEKYKFPNLIGSNLFKANFFDTEHLFNEKIKQEKPLFILGNPPWKSKKDDTIHTNWLKQNGKTVGNYEIAQSFLLRTKDFMQSDTQAALIVTSTMFYNVSKPNREFKKEFLTTYCVNKFFDLSPVRRLIFEEKDSPASIVYFRLPKEKGEHLTNIVNHQSVKINRFLKYFKMLVIEKFDQKEIQQKHFIDNDWLFKVALYGNVLDFVLINKLKINSNNLLKLINDSNQLLFKGAGIKENPPKNIPFTQLIGLKIIENKNIDKFYSNISSLKILEENDLYLQSARKIELFNRKKIVLKEQTKYESDIVVSFIPENIVYKNGVYGISFNDDKLLNMLYSFLISDLYTYYMFYIAGSWGTSTRPQIRLDEEYLSFPIIEPDEKTKTGLINLVNQFLKPFEEYYKKDARSESLPINQAILAQINNIINHLYGINEYEKDLIDYVLNISRYQFQESKQHLLNFTNDKNHFRYRDFVLKQYAEIYLKEFGKIYTDEFIQVEIYSLNHFIAMNFVFLDEKPEKQIVYSKKTEETEVLKLLANNLSVSQITNTEDPTKNLFIQKDIKGFEANSFYIIKPNEYKCWHRAMAWYDVAEFTEAIEKAELKRFNQIEE
ncbi:type I endonuclease-methyltransferase fusion protein [Bacteroidia bacterium]|nr:type I endonuclease-methyltransferase fusion protein [Bacteroidia bacterium]